MNGSDGQLIRQAADHPVSNLAIKISIGDDLSSSLDFKYTRVCTDSRDCANTDGLVVRLSEG